MRNYIGRGLAVGFIKHGQLEAIVSAKEIGDFAGEPDARRAALDHTRRMLDGWRKHFPGENLRVVEISYDKCRKELDLSGWSYA